MSDRSGTPSGAAPSRPGPPGPSSRRGGNQRIPRPPTFELGPAAAWDVLAASKRIVTVADVRAACALLGEPAVEPEFTLPPGGPAPRLAAVLLAVFSETGDDDGEARVVLTRRPDTMPSHQGEVAFPGGGHQAGDASLAATALREAHEEVGLDPAAVEVIGELDTLGPTRTGFLVHPFVGVLARRPVLRPDPREVARVFDVALTELLDDGVHHEELWDYPGLNRSIFFYDLADETIWGATARILTRFLLRLVDSRL
jgi:8-oxo-dGTP pyrophosphatase MutT (NUDIX family)